MAFGDRAGRVKMPEVYREKAMLGAHLRILSVAWDHAGHVSLQPPSANGCRQRRGRKLRYMAFGQPRVWA